VCLTSPVIRPRLRLDGRREEGSERFDFMNCLHSSLRLLEEHGATTGRSSPAGSSPTSTGCTTARAAIVALLGMIRQKRLEEILLR
jgi:hypothetical protein